MTPDHYVIKINDEHYLDALNQPSSREHAQMYSHEWQARRAVQHQDPKSTYEIEYVPVVYSDGEKLELLKSKIEAMIEDDGPLNHLHVASMYKQYMEECNDYPEGYVFGWAN